MHQRVLAVLTALTLLTASVAVADTVITRKTTGGPDGKRQSTSTTWVAANKMSERDGDRGFIVDLDRKRIYLLDHAKSTYSPVDLPVDFKKISPQLAAMIEQGMEQMKMDVTVTPSDERADKGGYPCRRYDVRMSNPMGVEMQIVLWVTDKIKTDTEAWKRLTLQMAQLQPGAGDVAKKLMAIQGFPVLQESTLSMMGNRMTTREELVSVEERDAPAGIYEPPTGYKETPFNPMAGMGG